MNAVLQLLAPFENAALALVGYLVTAVWMGAAIAALAALVLRLWKPLGAASRYAVWYVALIAVVLGPLVATVVGAHVRVVHVAAAPGVPAVPQVRVLHEAPAAALAAPDRRPEIAIPPLLAYGAAALWLLVVLAGAARFVAGAFVLARLKRDALPLSPERRAALPLWQSHAGAAHARAARLCVSDRVEVPVAVGLFDGMVVIPQQVLEEFEPGDVDRFVLHELAHLERRDDWTAVVQRLVQMVMFFNPAVHVIARRLDLEREIACDDRVVAATSDVRSYAVGLTRMAESTAWPHRGIAAPAIFVTRRQLSLRVEELLAGRRLDAPRLAAGPAILALVGSLGVVASAATFAPTFGSPRASANVSELTQLRMTKIVVTDRAGRRKTLDSSRSAVMVLRADQKTLDSIRALPHATPKDIDAILKRLGAHEPGPHVFDQVVEYSIRTQQHR